MNGKVSVKTSPSGAPVRIYCVGDLDNLHFMEGRSCYKDAVGHSELESSIFCLFFFSLLTELNPP